MIENDLPPIQEVPAAHLEGRGLANGWTTGPRVAREAGATGSCFSVCYEAHHQDGQSAFLKALNFPAAITGRGNFVDEVNALTTAYVFERDLLAECRDKKLSRIIRLLDHGQVSVPEAGPFLSTVPYLIFEQADGDIRAFQARQARLDCAWAFRVMKHTLQGLEQLHATRAAHQDLKPSNVLTQSGGSEMKLGDLGRADRKSVSGPVSDRSIPGAIAYAPPEQHYGSFRGTWEERMAADMYLAGSLGAQLFTGHCMSVLIQHSLPENFRVDRWQGTFQGVLPQLRSAHGAVIRDLQDSVQGLLGVDSSAEEFATAIGQLTDPNPAERGHPRDRFAKTSSFAVRRYVSLMELLSLRTRSVARGASIRG